MPFFLFIILSSSIISFSSVDNNSGKSAIHFAYTGEFITHNRFRSKIYEALKFKLLLLSGKVSFIEIKI